jgi:hypothetical protein
MNIYRNIHDGKLYNLYKVSPRGYTGHWLEAVPYIPSCSMCGRGPSVKISKNREKDYVLVAER